MSINTQGLSARKENLIFDLPFDFCFVQETFLSEQKALKGIASRWKGQNFWSPAIGKQGGVGILVRDQFDGNISSWLKDSSGRIVSVLVELFGFATSPLKDPALRSSARRPRCACRHGPLC